MRSLQKTLSTFSFKGQVIIFQLHPEPWGTTWEENSDLLNHRLFPAALEEDRGICSYSVSLTASSHGCTGANTLGSWSCLRFLILDQDAICHRWHRRSSHETQQGEGGRPGWKSVWIYFMLSFIGRREVWGESTGLKRSKQIGMS